MVTPIQGSDQKGEGFKIAVVTARFNSEVTFKLEEGAIETLKQAGVVGSNLGVVRVPGAVEVPLAVQALFESGFDGVVALGAVIRGETAHFDYVCRSVESGCTQLQLKWSRPIGFGVLTTDTDEQAMDRAGGKLGNKGAEAASVVIEMCNLLRSIKK